MTGQPITFPIRVTPKASSNRIVEATDDSVMKVYVTAVPEDGKANQAVLKLLSRYLGVAKSSLQIIQGETSRDKVVRLIRK